MLDDIRLFSVEVSQATIEQIYEESARIMCDASALTELRYDSTSSWTKPASGACASTARQSPTSR